jgi:hypothetical protein
MRPDRVRLSVLVAFVIMLLLYALSSPLYSIHCSTTCVPQSSPFPKSRSTQLDLRASNIQLEKTESETRGNRSRLKMQDVAVPRYPIGVADQFNSATQIYLQELASTVPMPREKRSKELSSQFDFTDQFWWPHRTRSQRVRKLS